MRSFGDGGHTGDSLMGLWFALSEIRDRSGDGIVIPSTLSSKMKEPIDMTNPVVRQREEKKADQATRVENEYLRSNFNRMMRGRK